MRYFPPLPASGPGGPTSPAPVPTLDLTFRRDRPLPEIVEYALQAGRHLDYHRAVFF